MNEEKFKKILELRNIIRRKEEIKLNKQMPHAMKQYRDKWLKGASAYFITDDSWDSFKSNFSHYERKDLSELKERRILIRGSKLSNFVEVEVKDVPFEEWEETKEWARFEMEDVLSKLPINGYDNNRNVTKEEYTKKKYDKKQSYEPKASLGEITLDDLGLTVGSSKQKNLVVQFVNQGKIDLDLAKSIKDDYNVLTQVIKLGFDT